MQKNYPEDFADAVEVDNLIRHGLKNTETELFLHKSAKPLGDINFLEPKKQQSLFGETFDEEFADECEGLCGVQWLKQDQLNTKEDENLVGRKEENALLSGEIKKPEGNYGKEKNRRKKSSITNTT